MKIKRIFLICILSLLISIPCFAREGVYVEGTLTLTSGVTETLPTPIAAAKSAVVYCEEEPLRVYFNGTDPTSTTGYKINPGNPIYLLEYDDVRQFRMIMDSTASGTTTTVTYSISTSDKIPELQRDQSIDGPIFISRQTIKVDSGVTSAMTIPSGAVSCRFYVKGGTINWALGTPSSVNGSTMYDGDPWYLDSYSQMNAWRATLDSSETASGVSVYVDYFSAED